VQGWSWRRSSSWPSRLTLGLWRLTLRQNSGPGMAGSSGRSESSKGLEPLRRLASLGGRPAVEAMRTVAKAWGRKQAVERRAELKDDQGRPAAHHLGLSSPRGPSPSSRHLAHRPSCSCHVLGGPFVLQGDSVLAATAQARWCAEAMAKGKARGDWGGGAWRRCWGSTGRTFLKSFQVPEDPRTL
jgi:hypothetical protein